MFTIFHVCNDSHTLFFQIIYGQTNCGKTTFMLEVIRKRLVEPWPKNVYYFYTVEQSFMKTWNEQQSTPITFVKGIDLTKIDTSAPSLAIFDDLVLSITNDLASLWLMGSHHRKITTFFLTQNLYPKSEAFRNMMNNSHYYVLFHSLRCFGQVHKLVTTLIHGQPRFRALNAYKRAGTQERGVAVFNLHPETPPELCFMTDFFHPCPSYFL